MDIKHASPNPKSKFIKLILIPGLLLYVKFRKPQPSSIFLVHGAQGNVDYMLSCPKVRP